MVHGSHPGEEAFAGVARGAVSEACMGATAWTARVRGGGEPGP